MMFLLAFVFSASLIYAADTQDVAAERVELAHLQESLLHEPSDGFTHYKIGLIYRQLGDDRRATVELQTAIQDGFDNLGAKLNLMEAAFASRQSWLGLETAKRVIASSSKSHEILLRVGAALFEHLFYKEALAAFQLAQQAAPAAFEPRFRVALTYFLLQEFSSTVATLNAPELAPLTPEAVALLASAEAKLGHFERAEAALRHSITLAPESAHSYINLALIDLDRGMDADAESLLENFRRLKVQGDAKVFYRVGRNSCHVISEAASRGEDNAHWSKEKAEFYYQLAVQLEEGFNFSSAIELLRLAQMYEGNSARVLLAAGTSCLNQDPQASEAVLLLRDAVARDPGLDRAYYLLGRAYIHLGRLDAAVGAYRKAAELRPSAAYYVSIGKALRGQQQAVNEFQRALSVDPSYAQAHLELGRAYGQLGQLQKARVELEKAIELEPDFYEAYYLLGRLMHKVGDEREAQRLLAQFTEKKAALSQQSVVGSGYVGDGN